MKVSQDALERGSAEIKNEVIAKVYLAISDLVSQNQYAKRLGMNVGKLNSSIQKVRKETS